MQFPGQVTGQSAQQRTAAGEQHARGGHICRQFRRGAFQHRPGGGHDPRGQLLNRFVEIMGIDQTPCREIGLPGMAAYFHDTLEFALGTAGHLFFQGLRRQRADGDLILFLDKLGNAAVKGIARHRNAGSAHPSAHTDDRNVGGTAADIHHHTAMGLPDLQAGAQRGSDRLIHQEDLPARRQP